MTRASDTASLKVMALQLESLLSGIGAKYSLRHEPNAPRTFWWGIAIGGFVMAVVGKVVG